MIRLRHRDPPPEQTVAAIRQSAQTLRHCDTAKLRDYADELRQHPTRAPASSGEFLVTGFALMYEALRRSLSVELYDVQLLAALALTGRAVAQMQTGEGKTFSCAPAAFWHALAGRGVHVVTPNAYLAQRDSQLLAPAFELLGMRVGLLPERAEPPDKRRAYDCDVTYGTAYEFGFDYLRDQLALRQPQRLRLGRKILQRLDGVDSQVTRMQRGLAYAIIDEIDNVLLDDAVSPLVLSHGAPGEATDANVHRLARDLLPQLVPETHYVRDPGGGALRLTSAGIEFIHQDPILVPIHQLRRTWTEYVEHALTAELFFRRDVHYVVQGEAIQIVDGSTGRIFSDRTWRDGMHQAVEAKEALPVTAEKLILAQITRQRFFRQYADLAGMTGTAQGCEREFQQVYGLRVIPIPTRIPSQRVTLPSRFFANAAAKWRAIADSIEALKANGRPVLVGTKTIADSEVLAAMLQNRHVAFRMLNGRQDEAEAQIVARAGEVGAITIATNLAGRGTDIPLSPEAAQLGGLHVIVAECHESSRIDRQLVGRSARQGDPGSCQSFVSADDALLQRYGPWLARSLRQFADEQGEMHSDWSDHIRRLQRIAERDSYAARAALLRQDLATHRLWTPRTE